MILVYDTKQTKRTYGVGVVGVEDDAGVTAIGPGSCFGGVTGPGPGGRCPPWGVGGVTLVVGLAEVVGTLLVGVTVVVGVMVAAADLTLDETGVEVAFTGEEEGDVAAAAAAAGVSSLPLRPWNSPNSVLGHCDDRDHLLDADEATTDATLRLQDAAPKVGAIG